MKCTHQLHTASYCIDEVLPMDIVEFANDIADFNLKLLVNKVRSKS